MDWNVFIFKFLIDTNACIVDDVLQMDFAEEFFNGALRSPNHKHVLVLFWEAHRTLTLSGSFGMVGPNWQKLMRKVLYAS